MKTEPENGVMSLHAKECHVFWPSLEARREVWSRLFQKEEPPEGTNLTSTLSLDI